MFSNSLLILAKLVTLISNVYSFDTTSARYNKESEVFFFFFASLKLLSTWMYFPHL